MRFLSQKPSKQSLEVIRTILLHHFNFMQWCAKSTEFFLGEQLFFSGRDMGKQGWGWVLAGLWLCGCLARRPNKGPSTCMASSETVSKGCGSLALDTQSLPALLALACQVQPFWQRVCFFQVQSSFYKSQIMYHYAQVQY